MSFHCDLKRFRGVDLENLQPYELEKHYHKAAWPSDTGIEYLGLTSDEVLVSTDLVRCGIVLLSYGIRRHGMRATHNIALP